MTLFDISIILVLLSFLPLTIGIVGLWITAIRFAIFQIWEDNQDDWMEKLAKDARNKKGNILPKE
jgi:hypothetical protein|tara:strand:+ start:67 stop:261 length:195 start_codon:yes stop_codon:yes gene_type:complete